MGLFTIIFTPLQSYFTALSSSELVKRTFLISLQEQFLHQVSQRRLTVIYFLFMFIILIHPHSLSFTELFCSQCRSWHFVCRRSAYLLIFISQWVYCTCGKNRINEHATFLLQV